MKRLTNRSPNNLTIMPECRIDEIINRLTEIEDILGDDYDLDRLDVILSQVMTMRQEVAERYRLTGKIKLDRLKKIIEAESVIGKRIWITKWFTKGVRLKNPPISRTVINYLCLRNGEILLQLKDGALPLSLIGICAYKTQKEAESALNGENNDENIGKL